MALPPTNAHMKNGAKMGSGSDPKGMDTAHGEMCCEAAAMKSAAGASLSTMTSGTTANRPGITRRIATAKE